MSNGGRNTACLHCHYRRSLLREFRYAESKRGGRTPRRYLQSRARRRHLHALVSGKAPDLSRPHFYRVFRPWTFLAHLPRLVRPRSPLMSIKGFHIVFIVFSTLLALGIGCYCVWVDLTVGEPVYRTGAIASFVSAVVLIVYGVLFYRKMKRLRLIT